MSFTPEAYRTARENVADRFLTTYGAAFGDESSGPLPYYDPEVASLPPLTSRRYAGVTQLLDFPFLNTQLQQPTARLGLYNTDTARLSLYNNDTARLGLYNNDNSSCKDCREAPKEQLACGHRFCGRHFDELRISDNPIRRRRQLECDTCGRWTTRDDFFISYDSVGYTAGDPPSDKNLGRLARTLHRDSPRSLAALLDIPEAAVETARDTYALNDESVQRMRVLYTWRMSNPNRSTADLINLLSRTNSYYYRDLTSAINAKIRRQQYDIPNEILDNVTQFDNDLFVASEHIGREFPFLMLELGLLWMEIETQKYTYARDLTHVIYQLLLLWRVKNYQGSTTRQLLDACNFLGINTSELEKQIKSRKHLPFYKQTDYLDSIYANAYTI